MVNSLETALPKLQSLLEAIKQSFEEEDSKTPSEYRLKQIPEISSDSRLISAGGCRLKLYVNGGNPQAEAMSMFVNVQSFKKGAKSSQDSICRFFDLLNQNENILAAFGVLGTKVHIRRAFLIDGREVTDVDMLTSGAEVWLSLGESYVPVECKSMDTYLFHEIKVGR